MKRTRLRLPRRRERLPPKPDWDGIIAGWTAKHAATNAWRTQPENDRDDLVQEGYMIYRRLRARYAHVTETRHFMSLYQSAFRNFVNTLANTRTKRNEVSAHLSEGGDETTLFDLVPSSDAVDLIELHILLDDAPADLRNAALAVLEEGDVVYNRVNGIRETRAERLQRLGGADAAPDVLGRLRDFVLAAFPQFSVHGSVIK